MALVFRWEHWGRMNQLKVNQQQSILLLRQQGWSKRRIARELALDRGTMRKYLADAEPKLVQHPRAGPMAAQSAEPTPGGLSGQLGYQQIERASAPPPRFSPSWESGTGVRSAFQARFHWQTLISTRFPTCGGSGSRRRQSPRHASVAQLDRASDFGSEGCRFESCRMRHSLSSACGV